jgi:hypothetical protein
MDSGANIHVCADASMFSSYQVGRSGALLMGNGSRAHVLGVGTVILKFTSGKTVPLKMDTKLFLSLINVCFDAMSRWIQSCS